MHGDGAYLVFLYVLDFRRRNGKIMFIVMLQFESR
jgi:hypothetical protein